MHFNIFVPVINVFYIYRLLVLIVRLVSLHVVNVC